MCIQSSNDWPCSPNLLVQKPISKYDKRLAVFKVSFALSGSPHVQLKSDQMVRLLNKHYVNEVHLTGQNLT